MLMSENIIIPIRRKIQSSTFLYLIIKMTFLSHVIRLKIVITTFSVGKRRQKYNNHHVVRQYF